MNRILTPFFLMLFASELAQAGSAIVPCVQNGLEPSAKRSLVERMKDPQFEAQVNAVLQESLSGDEARRKALKELEQLLGIDEVNADYYLTLYEKRMRPAGSKPIQMYEAGKEAPPGTRVAYSTASAPPEMLAKELPVVEYSSLIHSPERYEDSAKQAVVRFKKLQAGTGTSVKRKKYLARLLGIPEERVKIGAKGTDLFVELPSRAHPGRTELHSLAEVQVLRSIIDVDQGKFGGAIFHDIVSAGSDDSTAESIEKMWSLPSWFDPSKTNRQLVESRAGLAHSGQTVQYQVPALDEAGKATGKRLYPAGHALFAVDEYHSVLGAPLAATLKGKPVIDVLGNGEDLGLVDETMVGYVVKSKAPITLVTTERTESDMKGGLVSLVTGDGKPYVTVLETAQAESAGQLKLFETEGLAQRTASRKAMVSTNMTLFNRAELEPRLHKLADEVGIEELKRISGPDLILNWKEQDGKKYLQLEGAMGSSIMNLDRYWRQRYGEPLVHFINVDRSRRTQFFAPVKSAFDYWLQFHSDRFSLDPVTLRLVNHRPGALPLVSLSGGNGYYSDVQNVLDSFASTKVTALDSLKIDGPVILGPVSLQGKVEIINESGARFDLGEYAKTHSVIKDAKLVIGKDGSVLASHLN